MSPNCGIALCYRENKSTIQYAIWQIIPKLYKPIQ